MPKRLEAIGGDALEPVERQGEPGDSACQQ
jgi:hypothetical protein